MRPDEGMWKGGTFKFSVFVPEEYNIKVIALLDDHVQLANEH